MPLPKRPQIRPDRKAEEEFNKALGHALARWQYVETGLYAIAHCLLKTTHKLSSIAFFHVKSAESKLGLVDKLCAHELNQSIYQRKWIPIRKLFPNLVKVRNSIAHFEFGWLDTDFATGKTMYPIVLTSNHLDAHSSRSGATEGLFVEDLWKASHEFTELSKLLIRFCVENIPDWQARSESLPQGLRQFLESSAQKTKS